MFEHHWEITIFSLNLFYMITAGSFCGIPEFPSFRITKNVAKLDAPVVPNILSIALHEIMSRPKAG